MIGKWLKTSRRQTFYKHSATQQVLRQFTNCSFVTQQSVQARIILFRRCPLALLHSVASLSRINEPRDLYQNIKDTRI